MKAFIHTEFRALRNPGDKKNATIEAGEVVDGDLAKAAIANGFGEEAPEDTPLDNRAIHRAALKAEADKPADRRDQKREQRRKQAEGEGV